MKTITITAHNRPANLQQMLESLVVNDLTGYSIFARCEPGTPDCPHLIKKYLPQAHVVVNGRQLGVRENPFRVLVDAFNAGSQLNLYLEDDLVLSPDAVQLVNWFAGLSLPEDDKECLCLHLLCYDSNPAQPAAVQWRKNEFNALGLALTRASWERHFRPQWFVDVPNDPTVGWDWAVHRHLKASPQLYTLQPVLARANHTGRVGTYCRPSYHDRTFGTLAISQNSGNIAFQLLDA